MDTPFSTGNKLLSDFLDEYKNWWGKYHKTITDSIELERDATKNDYIPYLELYPSFQIPSSSPKVLFVSCNPSGKDLSYYVDKHDDPNNIIVGFPDFFYYDKPILSSSCKTFISDLQIPSITDFAMIDVFPIVKSSQKGIEKAWERVRNKENTLHGAFTALFDIFQRIVLRIKPDVIIIPNAFIGTLFESGVLSSKTVIVDLTSFVLEYQDNNSTTFRTTAFASSMLSGGRIDRYSYARLVKEVKNYLKIPSYEYFNSFSNSTLNASI